jgi:PAS domain S-box-containing protein
MVRKLTKPKARNSASDLRSEAEKKLAGKAAAAPALKTSTPEELIHELQVHQIELEMQNEALRESRIALEESRDKYLDLYEFAPVGYLTLTASAIIGEANLTGASLLGVDRRKLIKGRFRSFVAAEDHEKWDRYFAHSLQGSGEQTADLKLQRPDRSLFDARLASIPVEREGRDPGIRLTISDITANKRAEERLRIFQTFMENARDIILFIRKHDGKILEANRKASDVYGYSHEELLDMTVFNLRSHDPKSLVVQQMGAADETGILFEAVHRRKSGEDLPVEINSFSMILDGEPVLFSIVRDITRRKQAEEAIIRLSEERKTLIDNVPAMIWYKDTRNNFIRVNPAGARTFGVPVEEIEGKSANDLFPDNAENYYRDDLEVINSGRPKFGIIEEMPLAGGGKIWVRTEKVPIKDETGRVTGLLVFSVDITEIKCAEDELVRRSYEVSAINEELTAAGDELRRNEERLTASLEEKEVLLAEVHHRVKNNLAAFISLLALDGTFEETPTSQRLKKELQNRARSMALIHETLYRTRNFSHLDMGVYLETLTGQVAGTYQLGQPVRTLVTADGVNLDLARATPCGLIVNELVTNVFKYAFPQGFDCMAVRGEPCTLRISLARTNGDIILSVRDNGIGIPAAFDPASAKSLGLKLVYFLARHQLRATTGVFRQNGTEFAIQFKEKVS